MIPAYPLISVNYARTIDGDRVFDVIAQGAGIPESSRRDLFDEMRRVLASWGYLADAVSLTVGEAIHVAPCSVSMLAETFARKVVEYIDAECREAA